MQIDHLQSKAHFRDLKSDISKLNDYSNLMPSCQPCNFYKSYGTLEEFRARLDTIIDTLNKQFIFKLGKKYDMIQTFREPVKFYFEEL